MVTLLLSTVRAPANSALLELLLLLLFAKSGELVVHGQDSANMAAHTVIILLLAEPETEVPVD